MNWLVTCSISPAPLIFPCSKNTHGLPEPQQSVCHAVLAVTQSNPFDQADPLNIAGSNGPMRGNPTRVSQNLFSYAIPAHYSPASFLHKILQWSLREDLTGRPVLFWPVGSYPIIYDPQVQPLAIVRVVHGARDVPNLF